VPSVSVLSYDSKLGAYRNVDAGIEQTYARMSVVSGMVNFLWRASITAGTEVSNIALRLNDFTNVEHLDQYAGTIAHLSQDTPTDPTTPYRLHPIFLQQLTLGDRRSALYLMSHPGMFIPLKANANDLLQVSAQFIV